MDLETAQTTTTKLPILKQGDIIENGNSFKAEAKITEAEGTTTTVIPGPVSAEEKLQKRNDVKVRSMLLMTLPITIVERFNQYKDAQTMFAAIQTRFGGNEATKKTQKTLLKQIFESLPTEWNTHVVVWRNKPDLDKMSFDDLYNNFKIVEQEVKRTTTLSSSLSSQNMAFVSSPGTNTTNLSDATVYAFLANQPNGSHLVHEDLEQIHEDELEEMDLKWKLALLSLRARRFSKKTGKKITINPNDNYDEVPTNMALMAFSDSKMSHTKTQILVSIKRKLKKLMEEKGSFQLKIENFEKASESLDKILESQIPENSKKGLGYESYNVVPPPTTGLFAPPKIDFSNSGLEEFKEPKFEGYRPKASKNVSTDAPIIEDWESDSDEEDQPKPKVVKKIVESKTVKQDVVSDGKLKKKIVFPTAANIEVVKPKQQENPVRKPVKYAEMYRSQKPRGNQRNWNNQKSHQLGSDFVMNNKACFACRSFNHLIKDCKRKVQKPIWNNARRVNHHNSHRIPSLTKRNFVPKAVLMKTGMRPVNVAKPKAAYKVVKRNRFNDVKASACWVWMLKNRVIDAQAPGSKSAAKKKKNLENSAANSRKTKKISVYKESS
ncbi:hypothetical protein Tco_0419378 [Tanacetum coccineum]